MTLGTIAHPPGSSVQGILQARILEWVAFPFSRGSSPPRDRSPVSCIAGGLLPAEPPVTGGARLWIIFQNHFPLSSKECLVISQKQTHLLKWGSLGGQESMGGRSCKGYEIDSGGGGRWGRDPPSPQRMIVNCVTGSQKVLWV